jgi:hypothetical protein
MPAKTWWWLLAALTLNAAPRVHVGEPVLVVEGPATEKRWGRYQFPSFSPMADGSLAAFVHVEADAAASYGLPQKVFVTSDGGATWHADDDAGKRAHGLLLSNGDRLLIATTAPIPVADRTLPAPAGEQISYKVASTVYRMRDLAPEFRLIFFDRYPRGASSWERESTPLDDPKGFRYSTQGLFPRIWWGDMRIAPDQSLVALVYPALDKIGKQFYHSPTCYLSLDQGKTWRQRGRIRYQPDLAADPVGKQRGGFGEPALEVLRDGSLVSVLRTTDGHGVGPLYLSRSRDLGKHWIKPAAFTKYGVMPRLLLLKNGTLVLATGRPGAELRFSFDGRGESWSEPYRLVPIQSENVQGDSCGYTDLTPLDDHSFLVIYSWFKRPGADGATHKAVLVRRVEVSER